jgi:hypothetical protein
MMEDDANPETVVGGFQRRMLEHYHYEEKGGRTAHEVTTQAGCTHRQLPAIIFLLILSHLDYRDSM